MADIWDDGYSYGWNDGLIAIQDILEDIEKCVLNQDKESMPDWYEWHLPTITKTLVRIKSLLEQEQIQNEGETNE